jgi:hypothetical protein
LLALELPFEFAVMIGMAFIAVGASAGLSLVIMTLHASIEARHEDIAGLLAVRSILVALLALKRLVAVVVEDTVFVPDTQHPKRLITWQAIGPLGRTGLLLMAVLTAASAIE